MIKKMKRPFYAFTISLFVTLICSGTAHSGVSMTLGADVKYLYGYLLYQIGNEFIDTDGVTYSIPDTISQLKFPINTPAVNVNLDFVFNNWIILQLNVLKNVPYLNGKMEDSDWGVWYLYGYPWADENTLDIFSQSDAVMDLWHADISFKYLFYYYPPLTFGVNLNLEYNYYHYNINNVDQWYPSYSRYYPYISSGYSIHYYFNELSIVYEVNKITAPIGFLITLDMAKNMKLTLEIDGIVGMIIDIDDHVLRKKRSIGTLTLYGCRFDLGMNWDLAAHWSLNAKISGEYDTASGMQSQNRYETTLEGPAGAMGQIGEKWESMYLSIGVGVKYLF